MTFQRTQKPNSSNLLERFKGKPFWILDNKEHYIQFLAHKNHRLDNSACCFNHIIGLPRKNNTKALPLFDYELNLLPKLQQYKYIMIKKATGLGVTEFFLRYMAWLCLADNRYSGSQFPVVVGPNINLAKKLIKRVKDLFIPKLNYTFDTRETLITLNGVDIEAFPSHNVNSFRSLTNPKFIFIDEGDFFPPGQQQEVRDASERYKAKSDPYIVMVSTPNAPGGLFETIEKEDPSIYHRIFLDYTVGLDKIYTREDIEKAKQSPSFEREYNLKYLGLVGNLFRLDMIEKSEQLGLRYPEFNSFDDSYPKSIGIDPAFSSVGSKFGIVVTEYRDDIIRVLYAEETAGPTTESILAEIRDIRNKYAVAGENFKIYVDASNPAFIRSLKIDLGESPDYEAFYQKVENRDIHKLQYYMKVVPVSFNKYGKYMLGHMKDLVDREKVAINSNHVGSNLLTQMKMASVINSDQLDKSVNSLDLIDAFRLNLLFFNINPAKYNNQ